jgi:hypothetical protein
MVMRITVDKSFAIFQYLSLDVVGGSLCVASMSVKLLNIDPNQAWWLILALSVWIIYSTDHIFDSLRNKNKSSILRHKFFFTNRRWLIPLVIAITFINLILATAYLKPKIVISGIVLSLLVICYFFVINMAKSYKHAYIPKELIIAVIYVLGIFLAPVIWYGSIPPTEVLFIIICLIIIVFTEGIMISYYDYELDMADGHISFTTKYGKENTIRFLRVLNVLIEISLIIAIIRTDSDILFASILVLLTMNFFIGIIQLVPNNMVIKKFHRIIGEGIFYLPVIVYLFW